MIALLLSVGVLIFLVIAHRAIDGPKLPPIWLLPRKLAWTYLLTSVAFWYLLITASLRVQWLTESGDTLIAAVSIVVMSTQLLVSARVQRAVQSALQERSIAGQQVFRLIRLAYGVAAPIAVRSLRARR